MIPLYRYPRFICTWYINKSLPHFVQPSLIRNYVFLGMTLFSYSVIRVQNASTNPESKSLYFSFPNICIWPTEFRQFSPHTFLRLEFCMYDMCLLMSIPQGGVLGLARDVMRFFSRRWFPFIEVSLVESIPSFSS